MSDPSKIIRVYAGADDSQRLPYLVLEHSIKARTSHPVEIRPIDNSLIDAEPDIQFSAATNFSFARFAIPKLAAYEGRAIYLDSDMVVLRDIYEMWSSPFEGRKVQLQRPADVLTGLFLETQRQRQSAVMLLDCAALKDWVPEEIVAGLGSRYSYRELLVQLCLLSDSEIGETLHPGWNSMDRCHDETRLVHYTKMTTQPWVHVGHTFGHIWLSELTDMLSSGAITRATIEEEIEKGYVRPSLLDELDYLQDGKQDLDTSQLKALMATDRKAGFSKHEEAFSRNEKRRLAKQSVEPPQSDRDGGNSNQADAELDISFESAQNFLRNQDFGSAEKVLLRLAEAGAEIRVSYLLGMAIMRQKRFFEAMPHFSDVLELDPGHTDACFRRAVCAYRLGQVNQGVTDDFIRALELTEFKDAGKIKVACEYLLATAASPQLLIPKFQKFIRHMPEKDTGVQLALAAVLQEAGFGMMASGQFRKCLDDTGVSGLPDHYLGLWSGQHQWMQEPHELSALACQLEQEILAVSGHFASLLSACGSDFCIVGDSMDLIGKGMGEEIDAYPLVIRVCNADRMDFNPEDYGVRTDVRVVTDINRKTPPTDSLGLKHILVEGSNIHRSPHLFMLANSVISQGVSVELAPWRYWPELIEIMGRIPDPGILTAYWIFRLSGTFPSTRVYGLSPAFNQVMQSLTRNVL